jgi:phosphoglycerate dehydrogenase-like enzyme
MKPRILFALDDFAPEHVEAIAAAAAGWADWERIPGKTPEAEYAAKVAEAEVVIGAPKADWILASRARLLLLGTHGFDRYQGVGLEARPGFTLCNARGAYTIAVAESCVAMMLALPRRLPQHARDMRERAWKEREPYGELTGAAACVVGLGSIGWQIARRLVGLEMQVTGVEIREVSPPEGVRRMYPAEQMKQALAEADHVAVAVYGGPTTRGLFSADVLDALKPGAFFYNISRGSVVDEAALIERLRNGRLAGAGLDVFESEPLPPDSPLWEMDNVLLTPHIAGYSTQWQPRLRDLLIANLVNYRDGKPLLNVVMP